jgi:hypothetical protein
MQLTRPAQPLQQEVVSKVRAEDVKESVQRADSMF